MLKEELADGIRVDGGETSRNSKHELTENAVFFCTCERIQLRGGSKSTSLVHQEVVIRFAPPLASIRELSYGGFYSPAQIQ